jgi:hypothetical protein
MIPTHWNWHSYFATCPAITITRIIHLVGPLLLEWCTPSNAKMIMLCLFHTWPWLQAKCISPQLEPLTLLSKYFLWLWVPCSLNCLDLWEMELEGRKAWMYAIHGIDWNVGHSFAPSYTGLSIYFELFVGIRRNPSTERPLFLLKKNLHGHTDPSVLALCSFKHSVSGSCLILPWRTWKHIGSHAIQETQLLLLFYLLKCTKIQPGYHTTTSGHKKRLLDPFLKTTTWIHKQRNRKDELSSNPTDSPLYTFDATKWQLFR